MQNKTCTTKQEIPQYAEEDDEVVDDEPQQNSDSEDPFFNKLKINNFVISTTSALSGTGEFTSNNGINIIFSNINIKQKMSCCYMVGLNR